ncbi:MAG: cation:proton antiporter [Syntrophobacterales bacterium]|jgi:CPA2 family monovalent cation:H+ antiporter-2|nr:cation:proton antiporter [Syntrophobacterales bacterium]
MITEYLYLLIAVFGISGITIYFLGKARIPSIAGFLVGGVIIGPSGLNIITDANAIEILAEIGIIMLMFTIGLEFSLESLIEMKVPVFGGGALQVLLSVTTTAFLSYFLFIESVPKAIFFGTVLSLSSTAIVLKMIMDRGEMHTPYGRATIGVLIFQDLCAVLYLLLVPILAGKEAGPGMIAFTVVKAGLVVGGVLLSARWIIPWLLREIVRTRSRELFIITIIVLCLGTAVLTSMLGLSLALGAFLAGVVISESEYASQTVSDILPLKEAFSALFFIGIGMLLNFDILIGRLSIVAIVVLIMVVLKLLTAAIPEYITGQTVENSVRSGLCLAHIGEFSFVVAVAGKRAGLMAENEYQVFLSAAVLTMMATPFIISWSPKISPSIARLPGLRVLGADRNVPQEYYPEQLDGHVVIVGFGVNGGNLAKVLSQSSIPYIVLELNSETVRKARRRGEPVYYGDGTSITVLHKLGIQSAKVLVVAISDPSATRRIVKVARMNNPYLYIIARTRYVSEVDGLVKIGASEVIPEEFETSVEIFSKVLNYYHVPMEAIKENIDTIRADGYRALRTVHFSLTPRMETYLVKEGSYISGRTFAEIDLRAKTGITVVSIRRKETVYEIPSPSFKVNEGDILTLMGMRKDMKAAIAYIETGHI